MTDDVAFEVDCGEVLAGHRLRVTGLRRDGASDDADLADYSERGAGGPPHPMVSLTYAISPALDPGATSGRDVDAEIRIEPPADPAWWDPDRTWGAERDCTPGAPVTAGAFGPFVLPDSTRSVTVILRDVGITTDDTPPQDDGPPRLLGSLHVDLATGTASWHRS